MFDGKITAEEFKRLHNGICSVNHAATRLEGVIAPEIFKDIESGLTEIRSALGSLYQQEHEFFEAQQEHFTAVAADNNFNSIWSITEVRDLTAAHDLGDIQTLIYTNHWGKAGTVIIPVVGNTWLDLYRAADLAIAVSGDNHHVFIEAFETPIETPGQVVLQTGS